MRLALAFTLLAAKSAVPSSSSHEEAADPLDLSSLSQNGNLPTRDLRDVLAASSMDGRDGGIRSMVEESVLPVGGIKRMENHPGFLASLLRERATRTLSVQTAIDEGDVQGCDPTGADVGILSCGEGRYCVESTGHGAPGGVCVGRKHGTGAAPASLVVRAGRRRHLAGRPSRRRHLQAGATTVLDSLGELCNLTAGVTCETCAVDVDAYTATVNCTYDESCYMLGGYCGSNETMEFCETAHVMATVTGPGAYNSTLSFDVSQPDDFTYRVTFNSTGEDETEDKPACEIEVDGVVCTSCTPLVDNSTGTFCPAFDCDNTVVDASTQDCGFSISDAWAGAWLYNQLPCEGGCNLCGDGGRMGNPMEYFTIPNVATVNCFDTQLSALEGEFNEQQCSELRDLATEPCGCDGSPPPTPVPTQAPSESGSRPAALVAAWTHAAALVAAGAGWLLASV